jgi:antitoxin VapB
MTSSPVFTSNRSQAVRLPKAVAFPEDVHQVDILKIGRSRVIVPQGKRWDDLFQNGTRASEDFIVERCGPHDMQIGGHARSEGLIVVTNNLREFSRMPGIRTENWV